ncbi:MAG: hypothetical protein IPK97_09105 [Ahniella sp.]|nr:hypothetical protein [Ahniella sp.]
MLSVVFLATPDLSLDLALMPDRWEPFLRQYSTGRSVIPRCLQEVSPTSADAGSDSYSSTAVEIELGGFRDGTPQDFEDWLDQFVSSGGVIEIQGFSDTDFTESAPEDGWDRLERYWETRCDDDDGY